MKSCPSCQREFTKLADFPQVKITGIDEPETGIMAPAGIHPSFQPHEIQVAQGLKLLKNNQDFQAYLQKLRQFLNQTISPKQLELPFPSDGFFKWAHQVEKWKYYLGFEETELGFCQLNLYGNGPNFGSAGGPTLQILGSLLTIQYQGLIN